MTENPLTIGYVGNFKHPWCTEMHVKGSLEALGHRVIMLQEDTTSWRTLPRVLRARGAQMLLWTRTWAVNDNDCRAALQQLKDAGVPTVSYHLDRWWGLDREYQVESQPFFRTQLVVSPDGGSDDRWEAAGVNHLWMPPGVYEPECGEVAPDRTRFPHDVIFVGSYPYPHAEWHAHRAAVIEAMAAEFGDRFKVWAPAEMGHQIRGGDLQTLYASAKVVVGDSCLIGEPSLYWSDRVPETLGRGGLLVHPEVTGMGEWYANEVDLLTFPVGDPDAAVTAVAAALADPESAALIAKHGRETVLGRDTYRHRMMSLLEHVHDTIGFPAPQASSRPIATVARVRGREGRLAAPARVSEPRIEVMHRPTRTRGSFVVAQGDTDAIAVREVWVDDQYSVTRAQMLGQVVVDIGANVGAFSVLAARLGAARVLAYEPQPTAFEALKANAIANHATVIAGNNQAVMGDDHGDVLIVGDGGGAHVGDGTEDGVRVPTVSINKVMDPLEAVGLLKIDCEGSEYSIIEGFDTELLIRVRRIVMEFHGPGMPHLTHLRGDADFAAMVTKLAGYGRLTTFGRPMVGGVLTWERY